MQKTANQIKSEFELLASGHYQIHSFLYAQEFEQQAYENLIYPLMLVYPLGGSLSGTSYTRNYRVVIADRVLKSEGNELEVESDTQLIALDTLAYWMKLGTNERFSITSSNTITPFWEKWGDEVTGHFVDIGIEEFYDFNSCAIPLSSAIPSPTNPCKDARILINSVIYGNAPSDTNFNIVVKNQAGALVGSLIGGEWIVNTGVGCLDSTYTITNSIGTTLYTGTIPSGGSLTQAISNSTLNVNNSASTLISTRSILAQGTSSYNVADSVAVIKDSAGTTLKSENILATASKNITINDSVAVIKDSANNTLKSENILAQATENITISDSVAVIKDSANLTLKSENILAEATENIVINDSIVNVRKSDNVFINAVSVKAENTENYLVADSTITNDASNPTYSQLVKATEGLILPTQSIQNNGVASGFIPSVGTINVTTNSAPTSFTITGRTIDIIVPSVGTLLLDLYPFASGAYSLRKLRTAYSGNCIRVRRSSDNTEQDFGFVSGYLDTASMFTFVGANNGFVTTWYDQSGNARNAVQTTAANQPQIVSAGATIDIGGKPSLKFDGSNDQLIISHRPCINFLAVESVQKINTTSIGQMSLMVSEGGSAQLYIQWINTANNYFNYYVGSGLNSAMSTNQILLSFYMGVTTGGFYENGVLSRAMSQPSTVASSSLDMRIGSYTSSLFSNCNHQEFIIWEQNQNTRRTDIQLDIKNYYGL